MIIGLGIDFVNVNRMKHWSDVDGIIKRYFHENEIEAAKSRGSSYILSLAARFAAKEAFGKALGTGLKGLKLTDIEVKNNHNGKPEIILHETALDAFMDIGGKWVHLSLSHEEEAAVAVVIIEG
ncbi:MAG: 4'-phosphopantetheinyl transferase [Spirochaetes bacterium]|nr:MAG: 4'-phosphopantetheinyl transferase [Spirochaetota bacterium]